MYDKNKYTGKLGEDIACLYLEKKGWECISRNFQVFESEIDLIFRDVSRDEIVFVEVKTRHNEKDFFIEDAVTFRKLQKVSRGAEIFLTRNGLQEVYYRFDVIAIQIVGKKAHVRHIKNVYI